jgi:uncharacterized protein DUF5655
VWMCPDCGRNFAVRNQVHTCRPLGDLESWFDDVDPEVRATFDAFAAAVAECGPVEILPERTRIAFHHRMSFAVVVPRRRWLEGHLELADRIDDPRFRRVTTYSAHNHVHEFRLERPEQVDARFRGWIRDAYRSKSARTPSNRTARK